MNLSLYGAGANDQGQALVNHGQRYRLLLDGVDAPHRMQRLFVLARRRSDPELTPYDSSKNEGEMPHD